MNESSDRVKAFVQRRNHRLREALVFLETRQGGANKDEILAQVSAAVPPTPDDLERNNSGELKWETGFLWESTSLVKAGWLVKDGAGHWSITDAGRQALAHYPDPEEFIAVGEKAYQEWHAASRAARPRAWLIRGSSVSGHNLVPQWLGGSFVSLPAKNLIEIPNPYDKTELRVAVDEGYANRTSSYRSSIVKTYDRFLGQMSIGDPVLTTAEGMVHVGRVAGVAALVEEDTVPARLRRMVQWRSPQMGIAFADIPDPLPKRLGISGDLADLADDLEVIEAWVAGLEHVEDPSDLEAPVVEPPLILGPLRPASHQLGEDLHLGVRWLDRVIRILDRRKQVILYGPPGTGKTFVAQALAEHLSDEGNVTLVQFHPSYAYEDFVMGYRPVIGESDLGAGGGGGAVRFALKNGPLMRIAEQARDNKGVPHILIIDEINRANLAKVFGELYFLLEYRDRAINLLYSEDDSDDFYLPDNLFFIGTMNTADRSIALVDAAMRRRFAFLELHPSVEPVASVLRRWLSAQGHPAEAADLLEGLNSRIVDKDFQIGPSYFMKSWIYTDPDGLETVWETDLLPLLEEHHSGDGTDVPARYGLATVRAIAARKSAAAALAAAVPADVALESMDGEAGRV